MKGSVLIAKLRRKTILNLEEKNAFFVNKFSGIDPLSPLSSGMENAMAVG